MSVNAESEEHTKETVIDITSDSEEIVEAGTEEAADSHSCSRSVYYREGYRMREVCVRLSDISKTMSTPGSLNTSPAPVKRGRGRPRKSVSVSTPGSEEKSSPKITSFFKKKVLTESENSSACESPVKIRFSSPAKTAHLSETSLNSPSQRTQVKTVSRLNIPDNKENEDHSAAPANLPLLKFIDSSGEDITKVVKDTMSPEKKQPVETVDAVVTPHQLTDDSKIVSEKVHHAVEGNDLDVDHDHDNVIDQLLSVTGGPRVAVETSPAIAMEDVIHRLSCERTDESDQDSEHDHQRERNTGHEISADDEEDSDLAVTSSAWSSMNMLIAEPTKNKSPVKKHRSKETPGSSSKKYQRSKKMSSLIDNGETDTDEGAGEDPKFVKNHPYRRMLELNDKSEDDDDEDVVEISPPLGPPHNNDAPKRKSVSFVDVEEEPDHKDDVIETDCSLASTADSGCIERLDYTIKLSQSKSKVFSLNCKRTCQHYISRCSSFIFSCSFGVLDVVWARVGSHTWWPALITQDQEARNHIKLRKTGLKTVLDLHVTFLGENSRAWVVSIKRC